MRREQKLNTRAESSFSILSLAEGVGENLETLYGTFLRDLGADRGVGKKAKHLQGVLLYHFRGERSARE